MQEITSTALSPRAAMRQASEARRREDRRARMLVNWADRLQEAEPYVEKTPDLLASMKPLTDRHLWLLLGVVENEEREHLEFKRGCSAKTKWFDNVAPRVKRGPYGHSRGVTGFTTRIGADLKGLLRLSANGYVNVRAEGLAAVEYFRRRYPQLRPENGQALNPSQALELPGFLTVPNLAWRHWGE